MTHPTDIARTVRTRILRPLAQPDPVLLVASALLSALSMTGTRFATDFALAFSSAGDLAGFLVRLLVLWALVYVGARILFAYWDTAGESSRSSWRTTERRFFVLCAAVMLACWLIWIVPHWPGTMRDDSIPQYLQWKGFVGYYTQHPILDTFCFGAFWSLGEALGDPLHGLFIFLLVQALITALCFAGVLLYLRRRGVPRAFCVAALVFYACCRVIYQPVDTMSKDAWNGWLFVLACLMVFEAIRTRGVSLRAPRALAVTVIVLFLCIATKRAMMYIVVPALILGALALAVRRAGASNVMRMALAALLPAALFLGIWNPLVGTLTNADDPDNAARYELPTSSNEMLSIPLQQVFGAIADHPDALDATVRAALERYMDLDRALDLYTPWRSDDVMFRIYPDADVRDLLSVWVDLGLRYPESYAKAFMNLTGRWYSFSITIDYGHDLEDELLNDVRISNWSVFFPDGGTQEAEEVLSRFRSDRPAVLEAAYRLTERLDGIQARHLRPFVSFGMYCFALPLLTALWAAARRSGRAALMCAVPLLLVISFLVGPIALYWYTVPIAYICPLMLAIPFLAAPARSSGQTGTRYERSSR